MQNENKPLLVESCSVCEFSYARLTIGLDQAKEQHNGKGCKYLVATKDPHTSKRSSYGVSLFMGYYNHNVWEIVHTLLA